MTYNISALDNATTPVQIINGIHQISNGYFGATIFLLIYFITLMVVPDDYAPNVLVAVSFLMSIIAGIMVVLGFLPFWIIPLNITLLMGALFWRIWGG